MDRRNTAHPARDLLRKAGITQKQVAEYLCVSHGYAVALLGGKYRISPTKERQLWELVKKCRTKNLK